MQAAPDRLVAPNPSFAAQPKAPRMQPDVSTESSLAAELYFLIAKFLAQGPCSAVADVLKAELERGKILPQRLDWLGNEHGQSFKELENKYSHISSDHLLRICARIGPVLEKEVPPCVAGAISLLGAGRQSLLRTKEDMMRFFRTIADYTVRNGGKPLFNPPGTTPTLSLSKILQGRENSGPVSRREVVPTSFYSKMQLYRHTLGHLSAVYCVLFDRMGKYIITGADDLLVKVWSSTDGRLLATFRGASSEIMDIAVNFNNTLLAAGSLDKIIRVWCFKTMSPIAVLSGHTGMITSVNFCPIPCKGVNYLVSTSSDGSVAFWSHMKEDARVVFQPKPIQYHEKMRPGQAQMICASFSPGGAFMAAGSADHHVRVYMMLGDEGPKRVLEVEAHSDTVDSIQWAHTGLRFISGSKDGTANVWNFEQQQWQHNILVMHTKLAGQPVADEDTNKKMKVTMVCWDVSDEWVVTAVNDSSLKVWNSRTAELARVLRGHKDEVFVLESHPIDPRVILSAGHDGQLIIWDVLSTEPIACFQNFIEGQGNGAVFDAKWSADGTMIAATDSHGHLMMYGFGSKVQRLKIIPKELFFHTDYRPLIRDANNYVLDEQTQTAPHLMPPPFLVDVDGNPYPPALQRLVPGREDCPGEQLVPNIAVGASGHQEIIEGLPEDGLHPRSNIDRLIEALAHRQRIHGENNDHQYADQPMEEEHPARQVASPRGSRPGLRRVGDVEGVRQSSGNWQRDNTTPWNKPILARPINPAMLNTAYRQLNATAEAEMDLYKREMKRRPKEVSTATRPDQSRSQTRKKNQARHGYRTRATRGEEQEEDDDFENEESSGTSNESSSNEEELCSDSSTSDSSSEYSDWIADTGVNLEPPKRSKRKPVQKRPPPAAAPPRPATPTSDSERRRPQRPKKKVPALPSGTITEVPEIYRPPEWLGTTIPRKAPYYPQMGDEIVYFRQGHQRYLDAVRAKKIYEVSRMSEPWQKLALKAQEFVKVIGIKYEIRPPRLCCLKLALMSEDGQMTSKTFTIKYHDMADVLDFLVLRQTYDIAIERNWENGNRFRCVIDDEWWTGTIVSAQPLTEEFSQSFFMCFSIKWDNGETEFMSPWDLEPIDESRLPENPGGSVPVLPEEYQISVYQPQEEEWPEGDRDTVCNVIIEGLEQVMTLAIAEPFNAPVDLNVYPTYAYIVEYPIDLSTIKARFENRFYRRITSAQFDVRYLAANAETFNEPHSQIIKQARIVTDICLKIIKNATEQDVLALYHQILDGYHSSSDTDVDVEDINRPSTSSQRPTRSAAQRSANNAMQCISQDWRVSCKTLLDFLCQCEDSIPFREPVDSIDHPDYHQVIDTPMDLGTVKEDLYGGNYESPVEFAKDMKLIFTNSKNYNTNQRSKIYSMTVRLSAMFEEHMRKILNKWKSASRAKDRSANKSKNKSKRKTRSNKGSPTKNQMSNGAGPSKRKRESSDDDEDEDEEVDVEDEHMEEEEQEEEEEAQPGPSALTNGHSKRSARSSQSSRPALRPRTVGKSKTKRYQSDNDDDDEDDDEESSASSTSSGSDYSAENSRSKRRTRKNARQPKTVITNGHDDSDSGDDYEPSAKGKQTRNHRAKNSVKTRPNRTPEKRKYVVDEEDEEEEEEEEVEHDEEEEEKQEFAAEQSDESEDVIIARPRRQVAKVNIQESSDDEDEQQEEDVIIARPRRQVAKVNIQESSDDEDEQQQDEEEDENFEEVRPNEIAQQQTGEDNEDDDDDEEEEDDREPTAQSRNDEDYDLDEETQENGDSDDESENNQVLSNCNYTRGSSAMQTRKSRVSRDSDSSGPKRNLRRSRTKRMRYNFSDEEDDDDEDDDEDAAPKTRRIGKRPFYGEEASDEEGGGRNDPGRGISVSSRGRVRKMTPKAMSAFR